MTRLVVLALLMICASPAAAAPTQDWTAYIAEASLRFGVPESWIRRVILVESSGRSTSNGRPVRSSAGAMGLMQLMPGTWRAMRVAQDLGHDPDDPRDNILAGTAYLRAMYDRFGYPGLFAAYNAGPARYGDHLARGTRLPAETVRYLAKVTGTRDTAGTIQRVVPVGAAWRTPLFVGPSRRAPGSAGERRGDAAGDGVFFPRANPPGS